MIECVHDAISLMEDRCVERHYIVAKREHRRGNMGRQNIEKEGSGEAREADEKRQTKYQSTDAVPLELN